MTRRKRTPPPPPPSKRVAFEIPTSLQHLSAISRTLAQQADSLAGVDQGHQNTRITAQAPGPSHALPLVIHANEKSETYDPRFQNFVPETTHFPQENVWPQQYPRTSAISNPAGTSVLRAQIPPPAQVQPGRPPSLPTGPPYNVKAYPEPAAVEGGSLCLEKHPHQIAALIAQKRAQNEANRRREKWTQAQFAHRLAQAPDDQLVSELNNELSRQTENPPAAQAAAKVSNRETRAQSDRPGIPPKGIEQSQERLANSTRIQPKDHGAQNFLHARSQVSHGNDPRFSRHAISATTGPDQNQTPSLSLANANHNRSGLPPVGSSFVSQQFPEASFPSTNPAIFRPTSQTPNTSATREPIQHHPPTPSHPMSSIGPTGYYKIDPRLWTAANMSQQSFLPFQSPYGVMLSGDRRSYVENPRMAADRSVFRNLSQDRVGRYSDNGRLIEGVSAGNLSDERARAARREA